MFSRKAITLGCGIVGMLFVAGVVGVVLFFFYMAQDVKGVGVSVETAQDVLLGESFDLSVTVTNQRSRKTLALSDIDIAQEYLAGFTIARVEPQPKSSMDVPLDDTRSFTFDVRIPPGKAQTFTFTLRAEKPGLFRGDVDVCEGIRFISAMAQTSVKTADSSSPDNQGQTRR